MPPKKIDVSKTKKPDVFIKAKKESDKVNGNIESVNDESETIKQKYQKLKPIEHILKRPDTYIGDIKLQQETMWIWHFTKEKIIKKEIKYVPGQYKIFDEILVNARDQNSKDKTCTTIKVNFDKLDGDDEGNYKITIWNNGKGIDVVEHPEHKIYIPEMLFGELLTSTNYNDDEKRTTGGRNGYGAKLTNVFSKFFSVETLDGERKLRFYQEFKNNLSERTPAEITKISKNDETFTKITFIPDLSKFNIESLSDDMIALMAKRVVDMAGITTKIKVFLNDKKIEVTDFKKYIDLYVIDSTDIDNDTNSDESDNDSDDNSDNDSDGSDDDTDANANKNKDNIIYEEFGRWRFGVKYIPDNNFEQISFVNGICTYHGGTHVDYVVNQVVKRLEETIKKKHKDIKIKTSAIKENLVVFLDSVVENPAFASQTKETLTTKSTEFGSTYEPSDKFIKKLVATGIVEQIVNWAKLKDEATLSKLSGKKTSSIKGIPKLEDANWAGKSKAQQCYLILTEGDSAKALVMGGRTAIGTDGSNMFGVYPLRGKLLNVRDATVDQLKNNAEILDIIQIIGLRQGKNYKDTKDLRYGGIIIMTDADVDGYHIKGLVMNFIHYFWPSLMQNNDFVYTLSTPILKATCTTGKNKIVKAFYNQSDYEKWKAKPGSEKYSIKYYKGLGTSTKEEALEYFTDITKKLIKYTWCKGTYTDNEEDDVNKEDEKEDTEKENIDDDIIKQISEEIEIGNGNDETELDTTSKKKIVDQIITTEQAEQIGDAMDNEKEMVYKKAKLIKKIFGVPTKYDDDCTESLTLAFAKKRAGCRKIWLKHYDKNRILSNDQKIVPIPDYIHKELIHYSNDDNDRSIPSIVDGLKPSIRKILYGVILKRLFKKENEIKVAQLSGFISEKTCYHHGEDSLNGAIVGMAQNFVGSNNINILFPSGQHGSRLDGGKDAAQPRYIYTYMEELTRLIFREEDDAILKYLDDDGISVEPEWFCPIIPMVLVNGASGIGTGYSTKIPQYNPSDIINNLRLIMNNKSPVPMIPYYKNFKGTIEQVKPNEFIVKGIYNKIGDNKIHITELPVGTWTTPYKKFLEIKQKRDEKHKKAPLIDGYVSNCSDDAVDYLIKMDEDKLEKLEKNGKLEKTFKLSKSLKLSNMHLFDVDGHISKYNSPVAILLEFYETRLKMYTKRKEYLIGKIGRELDILYYKKEFIEKILDDTIIIKKQKKEKIIEKLVELKFPELARSPNDPNDKKNYEYLIDMALLSLTEEKIEELNKKYDDKKEELEKIKTTTEIEQWLVELDELEKAYNSWINKQNGTGSSKKVIKKAVITKTTATGKKKK